MFINGHIETLSELCFPDDLFVQKVLIAELFNIFSTRHLDEQKQKQNETLAVRCAKSIISEKEKSNYAICVFYNAVLKEDVSISLLASRWDYKCDRGEMENVFWFFMGRHKKVEFYTRTDSSFVGIVDGKLCFEWQSDAKNSNAFLSLSESVFANDVEEFTYTSYGAPSPARMTKIRMNEISIEFCKNVSLLSSPPPEGWKRAIETKSSIVYEYSCECTETRGTWTFKIAQEYNEEAKKTLYRVEGKNLNYCLRKLEDLSLRLETMNIAH